MKVFLFSLAAAFSVLASAPVCAQSSHVFEGKVFVDRDADGVLDKGEKGLGGVAVSDGFTVVLTDTEGNYSICADPKARFITVYTPDKFHNSNRFFCDVRDRMAGFRIEGDRLNRSNAALDFGLVPAKEYGSFAHMSDVEDRIYLEWIDRMKEYATVHDQDFYAVTGDICYATGLPFFAKHMNDENMGRRMVYTLGNHDLIKGYKDYLGNEYGEKLFEDCFGPCWYSFNVAGTHFIVTPMLAGDARPSYSREQIKEWIRQDLSVVPAGTPIVMFNHNIELSLVPDNASVKAFVYGHLHTDNCTIEKDGIQCYCSMSPSKASNDHSPSAFREITFTKEGTIRTKMHYTPITNKLVAHCTGGKVRSVVYDAASEPVKAEVISPEGKTIAMRQVTDMMWEADIASERYDAPYKIQATFTDGEKVITRQYPEPQLRWMVTLPARIAFTNPVLSDDCIFTSGIDTGNSEDCGIFCLNAKDGSVKWFTHTKFSVKGDIALYEGRIYCCDTSFNTYAIDASNGQILWCTRVSEAPDNSFTEGVHVADGLVYSGYGRALCALDASTGERVWTNTNKSGSITNVCTNRTLNGVLLANGYWVGRYCYDQYTGELLWQKKDYQNRYSSSTPALVDTTFLYTGYSSLMQVGARGGEIVKMAEFPYVFNTKSEPLVAGSKVFVGSSDSGIIAMNFEDFSQAWRYRTEPSVIYTSPYTEHRETTVECSAVEWKDNIIIGANDGFLYCLSQEKGAYVWSINLGVPVICKPIVKDNLLYFNDFSGNVYCYDLLKF